MDVCEDRRTQVAPCPWPYTLESECMESFAASASGMAYDGLAFGTVGVAVALWVCLLLRTLQIGVDTKFLRSKAVSRCVGKYPRNRTHYLNHYDRATLAMMLSASLLLVASVDVHAWRGVLDWRVYGAFKSAAFYFTLYAVLTVVDQFVAVSLMMTGATKMRRAGAVSTTGVPERRMLRGFMVVLLALSAVTIAAVVHRVGPSGTTDARMETPCYVVAVVLVLVALGRCFVAMQKILGHLSQANKEDAKTSTGTKSSKAVEVLRDRVAKRRRVARRTWVTFVSMVSITLLAAVDTGFRLAETLHGRAYFLPTPCGASSLVDLQIVAVVLVATFMLAMAPRRSARRDRSRANTYYASGAIKKRPPIRLFSDLGSSFSSVASGSMRRAPKIVQELAELGGMAEDTDVDDLSFRLHQKTGSYDTATTARSSDSGPLTPQTMVRMWAPPLRSSATREECERVGVPRADHRAGAADEESQAAPSDSAEDDPDATEASLLERGRMGMARLWHRSSLTSLWTDTAPRPGTLERRRVMHPSGTSSDFESPRASDASGGATPVVSLGDVFDVDPDDQERATELDDVLRKHSEAAINFAEDV